MPAIKEFRTKIILTMFASQEARGPALKVSSLKSLRGAALTLLGNACVSFQFRSLQAFTRGF
jgi:hypothetical protein